jgi:hypothetical protein
MKHSTIITIHEITPNVEEEEGKIVNVVKHKNIDIKIVTI